MITVYAIDIKMLPDPKEDAESLALLSKERRDKTMRYLQADDRKRCMGAGLLLHKILPMFGASPDKVDVDSNGKPIVDGVCFNLSHSEDLVICAVGDRAVGCDIERIKNAPEQVADHFFHAKEIEYLKSCGEQNFNETFYRIWTMKESYMKMTGEGMSLPLDQFAIMINREKAQICRDGRILSCHLKEYDMPEYKVTVCAEEHEFSNFIKFINVPTSSQGLA